MAILCTHKNTSETPLEAINRLRASGTIAPESKAVYAGRLDPMASGLLLILTDEDRFDLPRHLTHRKTYEAEIVLGIATDTFDALGIPTPPTNAATPDVEQVNRFLLGDHYLPFPAYSAYKVNGKPLHWWAQQNRLGEITIPETSMHVNAAHDLRVDTIPAKTMLADITERITHVTGNFRQAHILALWKRHLHHTDKTFIRVHVTLDVTSGTYIRSLAHALGKHLGTGAFLYQLRRTKIGPFTEPTV